MVGSYFSRNIYEKHFAKFHAFFPQKTAPKNRYDSHQCFCHDPSDAEQNHRSQIGQGNVSHETTQASVDLAWIYVGRCASVRLRCVRTVRVNTRTRIETRLNHELPTDVPSPATPTRARDAKTFWQWVSPSAALIWLAVAIEGVCISKRVNIWAARRYALAWRKMGSRLGHLSRTWERAEEISSRSTENGWIVSCDGFPGCGRKGEQFDRFGINFIGWFVQVCEPLYLLFLSSAVE